MGMFGSSKKTHTNTSISRIMEDADILDPRKVAVYDYIFDDKDMSISVNRESVGDYYAKQAGSTIYNNYSRARRWADKDNQYAYGVPKGNLYQQSSVNLVEVMDDYLERTLNKKVTLTYAVFGPARILHLGWQVLFNQYKYNGDTNELTHGGKVKALKDTQVVYSHYTIEDQASPDYLVQNGYPATWGKTSTREKDTKREHTPYISDSRDIDTCKVTLEDDTVFYLDLSAYIVTSAPPSDEMGTGGTNVPPTWKDASNELIDADYIMCQYVDDNGAMGVFTYLYGSNRVPELDNLYKSSREMGSYFPNMYLRLWSTNLAADIYKETDEYKTSVKLGKKLGMHWTELSKQIHAEVDDINSVVQCFLSMQVPVNGNDPLINKYLFEYFHGVYTSLPRSNVQTDFDSIEDAYINGMAKTGTTIVIKDKVHTTRISFGTMWYTDKVGTVGKVGDVTKEIKTTKLSTYKGTWFTTSQHTHIFRKQLTATIYRELHVANLTSTQEVVNGRTTTAVKDDENLIMPLDRGILSKFNNRDKVLLVSKSIHIIFNTVKVVKKKWYQTGLFNVIMLVIAVAISIFTYGAGTGLYAAVVAAAKGLAIGLAISVGLKIIINTFNIKLSGFLAVVAVVIVIYAGGAAASNTGTVMSMNSVQFMQAASYAFSMASQAGNLEMAKIIKEFQSKQLDMEAKFGELDKKLEELKLNPYMQQEYLLSNTYGVVPINVGESMDQLLYRTINVELGLAPIELIPNMVDLTVRLPTEQETLARIYQSNQEGQ